MSHPYFDGDKFDQDEYKKLIETTLPQWKDQNDMVKFASERIHTIISEENALRNNRMTWFASIEGFLWLSFAAATRQTDGCEPLWWLLLLIPIIGILICISAISVLWDADYAKEVLLKKWRVIQCHLTSSPYTHIPVLGLSPEEATAIRTIRIPHWHFVLFVLVGWVLGLVGVIVTKAAIWLKFPWWAHAISISISWIICWQMIASIFKLKTRPRSMLLFVIKSLISGPICIYYQYFGSGFEVDEFVLPS